MENTSPSHSSCIIPAAALSAGESSWAIHIAEFMASSSDVRQEIGRQRGGASESSFFSGFSSSLGDDDYSFVTSDLMDEDDEDDSLRDTACSSAAGPKVTTMYDLYKKSMATVDAKEMNASQLAMYFLDVGSRKPAAPGAVEEEIRGRNNNEKQLYECCDLRKKGLCLVPLSMFLDHLG